MHLLVASGTRPPAAFERLVAVASAAVGQDHRVTVLAPDVETAVWVGGESSGAGPAFPESSRVVRVPVPLGLDDPVVNRWTQQRVDAPAAWARAMADRMEAAFPDSALGLWRPRLEAAAYLVHRADPVDLVVVDASPPVTTAAALRLWSECDVPFVVDVPPGLLVPSRSGDRPGPWLERLLREASEVWVRDAAGAELLASGWPDLARPLVVDDAAIGPAVAAALASTREPAA